MTALANYMKLRLELPGGVLYGGAKQQTLDKLKMTRSSYYRMVKRCLQEGYLTKDQWGNYRILRSREFIEQGKKKEKPPRYSDTIRLETGSSIQEIKDVIRLKLLERRLYQKRYRPKKKAWIIRGSALGRVPNDQYAKFFKEGYTPLCREKAAKAMMCSPGTFSSWKKRNQGTLFLEKRRKYATGDPKGHGQYYSSVHGSTIIVLPTMYKTLVQYSSNRVPITHIRIPKRTRTWLRRHGVARTIQ